ncbi:MAG: ABC transporter permease [Dehalococcoidia bacterium]|nr:ABC transporter permease [Dehalococcoidia bacterium]
MAIEDVLLRGTTVARRWTIPLRELRRNLVPALAIGWVLLVAVLGPMVVPADPAKQSLQETFLPPVWQSGGTWDHPLGTDHHGRDVLARAVAGARASLLASFGGVTLAACVGTLLALAAGYLGGIIDALIGRAVEVVMAVPGMLLALIFATFLRPGLGTVVIMVGIVGWMGYARIIRSEILVLKSTDFVEYARISAVPTWKIMVRHLLPNVLNSVIVIATLQLGAIIIFESTLSFLGLGISPPDVSWGLMLSAGRDYVGVAWWLSVTPGVMIVITVLLMNWAGEWTRDRFDPRLRQLQ